MASVYTGAYAYINDLTGGPHFGVYGDPVNPIETTIASAAAIVPLSYISLITGTVQVANIALPWPGFAGDIVLIFTNGSPGATLTSGTANQGAIAIATTVAQFKALTMTYSQILGLWYPSY